MIVFFKEVVELLYLCEGKLRDLVFFVVEFLRIFCFGDVWNLNLCLKWMGFFSRNFWLLYLCIWYLVYCVIIFRLSFMNVYFFIIFWSKGCCIFLFVGLRVFGFDYGYVSIIVFYRGFECVMCYGWGFFFDFGDWWILFICFLYL